MEKFKLQPDEAVLKKGGANYWPPETKDMGALRAAFKVKQCVVFLTTTRLVGCTRIAGFPAGPLIWLISWLLGRKIFFEVALADIGKIEKTETGQQFIITAADGTEYRVAFDAFFDPRDQWLEAVTDAVAKADPNAKVHQSGSATEIGRA